MKTEQVSKRKMVLILFSGFFSVRTSLSVDENFWTNSSFFKVPTTNSFSVNEKLIITVRPISPSENEIKCHVRFHLETKKSSIHSHGRWRHQIQISEPQTFKIPLENSWIKYWRKTSTFVWRETVCFVALLDKSFERFPRETLVEPRTLNEKKSEIFLQHSETKIS